jgi:predicted GIY-YIG superfamily endonuclease
MIPGQTARSAAYHYGPGRDADHYVYRCYDAEDVLLYVGCTRNPKSRIAAHRRGSTSKASRWLSVTMTRVEVTGPFRGREAGREVERAAIRAELPVFNTQETATYDYAAWQYQRGAAQYLIDHGLIDLACETACSCFNDSLAEGRHDLDWCIPHAARAKRDAA